MSDRIALRVSYDWFEVVINELSSEWLPEIIEIVETVFRVLQQIEPDAHPKSAQVNWGTHLSLKAGEVDTFLREHLHGTEQQPSLIPEGFLFKLDWPEESTVQAPRLLVMRSILHEAALFISFSLEYSKPGKPIQLIQRAVKDHQQALMELGLKPSAQPEEEAIVW